MQIGTSLNNEPHIFEMTADGTKFFVLGRMIYSSDHPDVLANALVQQEARAAVYGAYYDAATAAETEKRVEFIKNYPNYRTDLLSEDA